MKCEELLRLLAAGQTCEETQFGTRYVTDCLYPSFERVAVFVSKWGDGFRVTDAGGAAKSVLMHGKDDSLTAMSKAFKAARQRHSVDTQDGVVAVETDEEWLPAAVIAVANASAMVADLAFQHVAHVVENALKALILKELKAHVPERHIAVDFDYVGKSTRSWHLDYAVTFPRLVLMKAVSPHSNSIFAGHTLFHDVGQDGPDRFAVFDRELKPEDAALMRQVSLMVPVKSVGAAAERVLNRPLSH